MASLDNHVSVSVSLSSFTPARKSFAIPLIADFNTRFPELVRSYSSLDAMVADGFTTEDAAYQVAQALMTQSPSVSLFKIGRLTGAQTVRVVTMLASARNSTIYTITINGRTYSFTSDATALASEIATGLAAVINADGTIPVTASVSVNNLVLTADTAGVDFFVSVANRGLWASINDTSTARASLDADLSAIAIADPNFYGLLLTRNCHLDQVAAATWVESRKRVFFTSAINYGAINSTLDNLASNATNLFGLLKAAGRKRTAAVFAYRDAEHPGAALLGRLMPKTPGTYTAKYKQLTGVTAEQLTDTEQANVEANNGNHYQTVNSVDILSPGIASAGKPYWIDSVILTDWLTARIAEEIFAAFLFNEKIPYTDEGIAIIDACMRKVLTQAEQNGAIRAGWTTTVPRAANVSTVDKGNRWLNDCRFDANEAGAIHGTTITGRLAA